MTHSLDQVICISPLIIPLIIIPVFSHATHQKEHLDRPENTPRSAHYEKRHVTKCVPLVKYVLVISEN